MPPKITVATPVKTNGKLNSGVTEGIKSDVAALIKGVKVSRSNKCHPKSQWLLARCVHAITVLNNQNTLYFT